MLSPEQILNRTQEKVNTDLLLELIKKVENFKESKDEAKWDKETFAFLNEILSTKQNILTSSQASLSEPESTVELESLVRLSTSLGDSHSRSLSRDASPNPYSSRASGESLSRPMDGMRRGSVSRITEFNIVSPREDFKKQVSFRVSKEPSTTSSSGDQTNKSPLKTNIIVSPFITTENSKPSLIQLPRLPTLPLNSLSPQDFSPRTKRKKDLPEPSPPKTDLDDLLDYINESVSDKVPDYFDNIESDSFLDLLNYNGDIEPINIVLERQVRSLMKLLRQKTEECENLKKQNFVKSGGSSTPHGDAHRLVTNFRFLVNELSMLENPPKEPVQLLIEKIISSYYDALAWGIMAHGEGQREILDITKINELLEILNLSRHISKKEDIRRETSSSKLTVSDSMLLQVKNKSESKEKSVRGSRSSSIKNMKSKTIQKIDQQIIDTFCGYCEVADLENIKSMLKVNVSIINYCNSSDQSVFYCCIKSESISLLIFLLNLVNTPHTLNTKMDYINGGTVLHYVTSLSLVKDLTVINTMVALLLSKGADPSIVDNDGKSPKESMPNFLDENMVFNIFEKYHLDGLRQIFPIVSEVAGPDSARKSPKRNDKTETKFNLDTFSSVMSPRARRFSNSPKNSNIDKSKKHTKDIILELQSEIESIAVDACIPMPSYLKDTTTKTMGPNLRFEVPGNVNTLSCCVKTSFASEPTLQNTVVVSTIAILNDVKIAVDPTFKLNHFDAIFTRKFLPESPRVWACIDTQAELIDGIYQFYFIFVFFKPEEGIARFAKFSSRGYTEWTHDINGKKNQITADPSQIPWLTKDGELSKKRVEKEIERLSKPSVQFQMFSISGNSTLIRFYQKLSRIDSFRFNFFHKMTIGIFFLSESMVGDKKVTLGKLIKNAGNATSQEFKYFLWILRRIKDDKSNIYDMDQPLSGSYKFTWNNITFNLVVSSAISKDDIRRIIGNSMMVIIYNNTGKIIDPSELKFGSVTLAICVVQQFISDAIPKHLIHYKVGFFLYCEKKTQDTPEDLGQHQKSIESKMSEVRFDPEIPCDSVFDEDSVQTIILGKLYNSLHAALSFHPFQKQLTTPVADSIQNIVIEFLPEWYNKLISSAKNDFK